MGIVTCEYFKRHNECLWEVKSSNRSSEEYDDKVWVNTKKKKNRRTSVLQGNQVKEGYISQVDKTWL